jgi:predicted RNase H-like nuclease (RuvC/YqgF family)
MSRTGKRPSIVELHTLEKEIHTLLGSYKRTQQEYMHILASKEKSNNAEKKLKTLNNMNASILSLVAKAKDKIAQLYHKGIKNQDKITLDNVKLNRIIQNMKKEDNKLNKLVRKLRSAEGENKDATLQQKSAYYQYVIFAILSIVVIALTIKTFTVSSSGYIETIILAMAIALILYHVWSSVF